MTRLPTLLAICLLLPTACAATGSTATPAPGHADSSQQVVDEGNITLNLGQDTKLSDGSRLSYTSLVNDSRCPPDVQCIWEGDAEIALRWKPVNSSAQDLRLHTSSKGGATSTRIGERTLTLVSLERGIGPKATLSISATP